MVKFQLAGTSELHTDPEIIKILVKSYQKGCGSFVSLNGETKISCRW